MPRPAPRVAPATRATAPSRSRVVVMPSRHYRMPIRKSSYPARVAGRPRTRSDADVFAATYRVVGRDGPARLTLAGVAAEVGLAPSTLAERFGSKRGLLLAAARAGVGGVEAAFPP